MTMMEFSGDSDRLRQIARAHAAGDLDQEDYRQIRTALLDALEDDPVAVAAAPPARTAQDAVGDDAVTMTLRLDGEPASGTGPDGAANHADAPSQLLVLVAAAAAGVLALVAGILLAG